VIEVRVNDSTLHAVVQGNLGPLVKVAAQYNLVNVATYEPSLEEIFLAFYREGPAAS